MTFDFVEARAARNTANAFAAQLRSFDVATRTAEADDLMSVAYQRAHGGATDRTGGAKHEHAEGLTGSHQVKMPLPGSAGNAETPDVCCGVSFRTRERP